MKVSPGKCNRTREGGSCTGNGSDRRILFSVRLPKRSDWAYVYRGSDPRKSRWGKESGGVTSVPDPPLDPGVHVVSVEVRNRNKTRPPTLTHVMTPCVLTHMYVRPRTYTVPRTRLHTRIHPRPDVSADWSQDRVDPVKDETVDDGAGGVDIFDYYRKGKVSKVEGSVLEVSQRVVAPPLSDPLPPCPQ